MTTLPFDVLKSLAKSKLACVNFQRLCLKWEKTSKLFKMYFFLKTFSSELCSPPPPVTQITRSRLPSWTQRQCRMCTLAHVFLLLSEFSANSYQCKDDIPAPLPLSQAPEADCRFWCKSPVTKANTITSGFSVTEQQQEYRILGVRM